MKISQAELAKMLEQAASRVVSQDEARYFAQESVESHARSSERTDPLKSAVNDLEACIKYKGNDIAFATNLPAFFSVDFNHQGPLPYLKRVHDELVTRSERNGIAMVAFTNSQGMHTLSAWVQGLARRGLVALAICNGGPAAVVPFNGTKGLFGTNPMAYALPEKDGEILCVDMATSEIPFFEILEAHKAGTPLRERSAVDQNGEFTTQASEALDFSESETDPVSNIVPMGGGYKGYNIVFLFELLTSGLLGMPSSPEMSSDFIPEEHGSFILVFNPQAFGTKEKLENSVQAVETALASQKAKAGEKIRIPGKSSSERLHEMQGKELDVDATLVERLKSLQE